MESTLFVHAELGLGIPRSPRIIHTAIVGGGGEVSKNSRRQRSQDSNKPQTPGQATRSKGFLKLLLYNWAGPGGLRHRKLLWKAGFQPPEKEEVDPLLKALKDNKDLLPKAVRVALDNHNGQELTIQEEGDQSSKDLVSASPQVSHPHQEENHLAGQGHSG